mgnify:CR=1 FL=1
MQQALGHGTHVSQELVGGDGHPFVVGLVGIQRSSPMRFGAIRIQVVDGRAVVQRRIAGSGRGEQSGFRVDVGDGQMAVIPIVAVRQFDVGFLRHIGIGQIIGLVRSVVVNRVNEVGSNLSALRVRLMVCCVKELITATLAPVNLSVPFEHKPNALKP